MTKQILIAKTPFTVSEPYAEGHVLTEMEARVLNQVRAENIGNNFRKAVDDCLKGVANAKSMETIQAEFAEYDKTYSFTAVRRTAAARLSPLDAEALRLAKAWIVGQLKAANKTLKAYVDEKGKDAFEAKMAEVAATADIQALAKKNLANQTKTPDLGIGL